MLYVPVSKDPNVLRVPVADLGASKLSGAPKVGEVPKVPAIPGFTGISEVQGMYSFVNVL